MEEVIEMCSCGEEATWELGTDDAQCSICYFDALEAEDEGPWCDPDWRE